MPHLWIGINDTKPLLNVGRNPFCEAASEEEVHGGFLSLVAKLIISVIFPSTELKPISTVHTLFWSTRQVKILHLGVAQGFHTVEGMIELVSPSKCILYAEDEEYEP
jgi:hypothetical protein